MSHEYPVIKEAIPVGQILNFQNEKKICFVIESDGIYYGEKGYLLSYIIIQSSNKAIIGKKESIDDRAFRDYNDNNIAVEDQSEHPIAMSQYKKIIEEKEKENNSKSEIAYRLLLTANQGNEADESVEVQTKNLIRNLYHLANDYNINLNEVIEESKYLYKSDLELFFK